MPTLEFKGKPIIYAHHIEVPIRPLSPDPDLSVDPTGSDGNLIIHGDNLHGLKALLPQYAGKVKCVYIDAPYNTGSQAWVYNDNVNSPLMREWLGKAVDLDDLERSDKWLCMMWPRLHLLKELLRDDGVIFLSIDDNEQWRLLGIMEEIFGPENFVETLLLIQSRGAFEGKWVRKVNEYIHVFAKDISLVDFGTFSKEVPSGGWPEDSHGPYRLTSSLARSTRMVGSPEDRPNLYFPIYVSPDQSISTDRLSPSDIEVYPQDGQGNATVWQWGRDKVDRDSEDLLVKPHKMMGYQFTIKRRPDGEDGIFREKPSSLWDKPSYSSASGTNMVKAIFDGERRFDFPKSVSLIEDLLRFANVGPNDIVLDSFAGSGTTAHAVLALNKEDEGNRKFILVECEYYADTTTAERVRRVIKGVPKARDASLREGLGGSFTYCTLGDPIDIEGMLTGEKLPDYRTFADFLLFVGHGIYEEDMAEDTPKAQKNEDGLFFSRGAFDYYLLYQPNIDWLRGKEGVLKEDQAKRIGAESIRNGRKAVVWAVDKGMTQRELSELGIIFCQIPYEMFNASEEFDHAT